MCELAGFEPTQVPTVLSGWHNQLRHYGLQFTQERLPRIELGHTRWQRVRQPIHHSRKNVRIISGESQSLNEQHTICRTAC